jgi:probable F420-dependent oxidoreductase
VELHVVLPSESPTLEPSTLIDIAKTAEALNFAGIMLPDHLLPGPGHNGTYGGVYEPLVTMSYLAAVTTSLALGTSVIVLPMRSPFVVAKQTAALAKLSGDRFVLGVGTGWDRSEFASVGANFAQRGEQTTEALRLIRHLHTIGHGPFANARYPFQEGGFAPIPDKPVPFLVGGTTDAALRRVAEIGDIWQGFAMNPRQFEQRLSVLRSMTDRPIIAGTRTEWTADEGSFEQLLDEINEFRAVGCQQLGIFFGDADGFGDRMRAIAEAVNAQ